MSTQFGPAYTTPMEDKISLLLSTLHDLHLQMKILWSIKYSYASKNSLRVPFGHECNAYLISVLGNFLFPHRPTRHLKNFIHDFYFRHVRIVCPALLIIIIINSSSISGGISSGSSRKVVVVMVIVVTVEVVVVGVVVVVVMVVLVVVE